MFKRKKICIIWLVNDKYINNFVTVYRECKKSFDFDIKVVAVPRLGYTFSPYISSKEVYDYLVSEGIECTNCYDEEKQEYLDIESLNPDYVFTTTPYDIYLPEKYRSSNIMFYAKLCNILYGSIVSPSVSETDYMANAYMIFTAGKKSSIDNSKCVDIGSMKLDEYLHYGRKKHRKDNKFQIAWKPRWTLNSDESNLVEYIESFYQWTREHSDYELLFITHPMLEKNAKNVGWKDYYKYMDLFEKADNISVIKGGNFMYDVMASDVFVADMSTTLIEFAVTGKPVIYTEGNTDQNELTREVIENSYVVKSFEEIDAALSALKSGKDILQRKRKVAAKSYFTIPPRKMSSAKYLLKILKTDYKKHPFIKKHLICIGDMAMVNGYGSSSAWGEKDETIKMENVKMNILNIREDGINKYGCAKIGYSDIACWVSETEVTYIV